MISLVTSHFKSERNSVVRIFVQILFCLFFSTVLGQENTSKKYLAEVISEVEARFSFRFTFANDVIEGISIIPPENTLTFEQTLDYIEKETGLIFTTLSSNFISINKRRKSSISSLYICGFIKEATTNRVIDNVTIRTKGASTISNPQGFFELEISGSKELILIDHIGYKSLSYSVNFFNQKKCPTIYLTEESVDLQEVVFKNYLTRGISKVRGGDFEIDYEDFGILPGLIETDVLHTVQALPGVYSADETVSNINIRGGTHDQNLILWDGIKMYQSGHFFGLISAFNPNITSDVTLVNNGSNVEYTDGVSGTILMKSAEEINTDFQASVGLNMINTDVFTDIPIGKKSSLQLAARKSINEYVKTPTYDSYFERISQDSELDMNNEVENTDIVFDFYDVNLRWNYKISNKDKVRLNFISINNDLVFTENTVRNDELLSRQSNVIQSSTAGGVFYERKWTPSLTSTLQLYETDYRLRAINANIQADQRFLQENKVSETGVKLNTSYALNEEINLQSGYQFIETGVTNLNDVDNPLFVEEFIRVIRTHGLFSQADYTSKNKNVVVNFGARYAYLDKFNKHLLEPRFRYSQKFLRDFNVEVLAERKHQTTSQVINFQNDFLGIEKRRWILSDEEAIPIVRSQQGSLGIQYKRKGWLGTMEIYYKMVEGITSQSQGFQNQYQFVPAIGDYTVAGAEFSVNKKMDNVSAWLSYSYAHNDYNFESLDVHEFPNNIDLTHSITLGGSYTVDGLKVSAGVNYNSGLPTTRPISSEPILDQRINYGMPNSLRLKEYIRADISMLYNFALKQDIKLDVGFSVWNIFDIRNSIDNYYTLNTDNSPVERIKSSLGLTPNATLRASF